MNLHLHTGAQVKIHEQGSTPRKIILLLKEGDKVAKLPATTWVSKCADAPHLDENCQIVTRELAFHHRDGTSKKP